MFSALAEPQQHRAKDEHDNNRGADDDGPGKRAGGRGEHRCDGRLCVCKKRGQKRIKTCLQLLSTAKRLFNKQVKSWRLKLTLFLLSINSYK